MTVGNTILLVCSSQVLIEITSKILSRAGYSVRSAAGIEGARELMADYVPDVILLENELPDGCGLEFCKELRKHSAVRILLVSGRMEDELPALSAGANDYIRKPFDYEILKARVAIVLNNKVSEAGDFISGAESAAV